MTATQIHRAIDAVWRIESAKLIAGLARIVRNVGLAEELAPDALVAALEQCPESGIPDTWVRGSRPPRSIVYSTGCEGANCSSVSTEILVTSFRLGRSWLWRNSTPRLTMI
jgi:hypothetical protein